MPRMRKRGRNQQPAVDEKRIIAVAARLFRRNGYDGTSMQDVANELGILKGSLYYHIESKEQLLIKALQESVADVHTAVEEVARSSLPPREKLQNFIRVEIETMIKHQNEILIWLTERGRNQAVVEKIEPEARKTDRLLRLVLDEGASAGDWPAMHLSLAYQAIRGMLAWIPTWYRANGRYTPEEIAEHFAAYTLRVLDTRPVGRAAGPRIGAE